MKVKHRVKINVTDRNGNRQEVLGAKYHNFPAGLIKLLFGDFSEIVVLNQGKTVEGIMIQEVPSDDVARKE